MDTGENRPREKCAGSSLIAFSWEWGQLGTEWQEAFNDENLPQPRPRSGLEVGPTLLDLPPLKVPCLLSEPGETNPYNFQHFSRGQPSITHPNMGSDCVGHDKEHKRSCAGTRNQDLSPQTELQRIRLSNRGLGDISEGLILRARAQGGGLLPAGRPRLCQHPIMGRAKMGLLQEGPCGVLVGRGGWGMGGERSKRE